LLKGEYLEAKILAERIAEKVGQPRFYLERTMQIETSTIILEEDLMVQAALAIVQREADQLGHGLSHVRKVAVDAGAIVIREMEGKVSEKRMRETALTVQLAGVLHDIKRAEPDHADRGAQEAEEILRGFPLNKRERVAIVQAIRNHEAFKPQIPLKEPSMQLVSDALYDADKFRWGPDNFTETVWLMVASRKVPLSSLMKRFLSGMEGIARIGETFRTVTGKEYGPDFIARGLEIGRRIYAQLGSQG
jgi:hypothetical protein